MKLQPDTIDTNIIVFRVDATIGTAAQFVAALEEHGVQTLAIGPNLVRAVTHLDVSRDDCIQAARAIATVADDLASGRKSARRASATY